MLLYPQLSTNTKKGIYLSGITFQASLLAKKWFGSLEVVDISKKSSAQKSRSHATDAKKDLFTRVPSVATTLRFPVTSDAILDRPYGLPINLPAFPLRK